MVKSYQNCIGVYEINIINIITSYHAVQLGRYVVEFYTCNLQCQSSIWAVVILIKTTDKIFWLRAFFGISTGLILGILSVRTDFNGSIGVFFAFLMYMVSYYIVRIKFAPELPVKDSRKIITTGLGSFVMLFLFTWILINTLFNF